jgi:hypothetical protein
MSGFSSYDQIIDTLTVQGLGQNYWFNKNSVTMSAGNLATLWATAGQPGVGTYPGTPLTARVVNSSTTGAIIFNNPTAPATLHLLKWRMSGTNAPNTFLLVDRLLDYATISATSTSLQSMDNTATLSRYTTGAGVQMWAEITTTFGGTSVTVTVTYTNQAGATGRTTTFTTPVSGGVPALAHTVGFFVPLAAGDTGVRKIESVQLSASTGAGVFAMALGMPFEDLPIATANLSVERNFVLHTPGMQQIVDNAALMFLFRSGASSTGNLEGALRAAAR